MKFLLFTLVYFTLNGCTTKPNILGIVNSHHLHPCPNKPNCVSSSNALDTAHYITPLKFSIPPLEMERLIIKSAKTQGYDLKSYKDHYVHFEATSLIFRFVDDIEFLIIPSKKIIHIRSASRVGYSDLGANRKRMEALIQDLKNLTSSTHNGKIITN